MNAADWTAIGTWAYTVATIALVGATITLVRVANRQLSSLISTLRMNGLMAVLQLESEMNSRKQRVDDVAAKIRTEHAKPTPDAKLIAILGDQMNGYLENWLNAADRLAYCISKGYVPERDWNVEYRYYFAGLVKNHADKFGPDSIYHNLIDLNHKWHRE